MNRPTFIDVEASGFGRNSYPIEIGVALADGNTRCFLIRPENEWTHWVTGRGALHGISRDMLFEKGLPVRQVCLELNELLDGMTVYSDNWGFDQTWISLMFEHAGLLARFNIETILAILSEEQLHQWDKTKDTTLLACGFQRHRASNDALVLQLTYTETLVAG